MLSKQIAAGIPKARLMEFLSLPKATKIAKAQLVTDIDALVEADPREMARLLDAFPKELAVGPLELQTLLQCSRAERRRWIKEGRIPVLEYHSFRKAGQTMLYPVHERRVVQSLSQEEIAQWREAYQAQVRERRKAGAQVAATQRKINQCRRQEFQLSWLRTVDEWSQQSSPEEATVLQLAYWTGWGSRWAKENHIRSLRGITRAHLYAIQRDSWYSRKNEAMHALSQTPYAQLSFYRPANADRRHLHLCETHYHMKWEECYENVWDFFYENPHLIRACPQCEVNEEKDYYALYYLEVAVPALPTTHFTFHMPYPLGKDQFPAPGKLPRVEHVEQEGLFRFGRSLFDSEKVTHREQDVLTHFEKALRETKGLFYSGC